MADAYWLMVSESCSEVIIVIIITIINVIVMRLTKRRHCWCHLAYPLKTISVMAAMCRLVPTDTDHRGLDLFSRDYREDFELLRGTVSPHPHSDSWLQHVCVFIYYHHKLKFNYGRLPSLKVFTRPCLRHL
jgi:hypothetical protein